LHTPARKLQLHSAQVAKRTAEKRKPRFANKQCRSAKHGIALQCSNVSEQDNLLEKKQKYEEKQKWHQRHNLTVLSTLPVARSGAVG
jgi:hypothetical protein